MCVYGKSYVTVCNVHFEFCQHHKYHDTNSTMDGKKMCMQAKSRVNDLKI